MPSDQLCRQECLCIEKIAGRVGSTVFASCIGNVGLIWCPDHLLLSPILRGAPKISFVHYPILSVRLFFDRLCGTALTYVVFRELDATAAACHPAYGIFCIGTDKASKTIVRPCVKSTHTTPWAVSWHILYVMVFSAAGKALRVALVQMVSAPWHRPLRHHNADRQTSDKISAPHHRYRHCPSLPTNI